MATIKKRNDVDDWLDTLDPTAQPASDASDLRRIGAAISNSEEAEDELTAAVASARAHGRTWAVIGMILGVSKQAAHARFSHKIAV